MGTSKTCSIGRPGESTFLDRMNGSQHKEALIVYTAIVLGHWAEHLVQTFQVYILGWAVPDARGVLGLWFPWLVKSEWMHYGYALVMLSAFWFLRRGFAGTSRTWWMVAFWIQFWHHIEHALLLGQALFQHNLFGAPVPMSILQLWIPRVELHLFYNSIVTIPMAIAMFFHMFPTKSEASGHHCSCAWGTRVELPA